MGVLQEGYCDLFIFTFHGNMTVRVPFQEEFWSTVFNKLCWFWTNFIIPEVLKPTVDSENTESETESESGAEKQPVTRFLDYNNNTAVPTCGIASAPTKSKQKQKNKKCRNARNTNLKVYLCGKCSQICVDNPKCNEEESVNCDACGLWFHFVCVGFKNEGQNEEWKCDACINGCVTQNKKSS